MDIMLYFAILPIVQSSGVFQVAKLATGCNLILHFLPKPNISSNLILQDLTTIVFAFVCLFVPMTRLPRISKSPTSDLHCNAPGRSCITKQDAVTMGRI